MSNDGLLLCRLEHLGLLELSGKDARTFLQGQVTNDVRLLDGRRSHLSAYCNPQGRLLALFLAFAHQDHLHLQFQNSLLEAVQKRLMAYVLRAQVQIRRNSEIVKFGIYGHGATALLSALFTPLPDMAEWDLVTLDKCTLIRLPGQQTRYEILSNASHAPSIWSALAQKSTTVNLAFWEWLDIEAGIPEIYPTTQGLFVPQVLNLEQLGALSFNKGCYTGQEIIARTHYLGKVKRQMYATNTVTSCVAGDVLYDALGREQGHVVRVAPHPKGGYALLVEKLVTQSSATLTVHGQPLEDSV